MADNPSKSMPRYAIKQLAEQIKQSIPADQLEEIRQAVADYEAEHGPAVVQETSDDVKN